MGSSIYHGHRWIGIVTFCLAYRKYAELPLSTWKEVHELHNFFLHFGVYIFVAAVGIILHFTLTKQEYSVACMHIYDEASQLKIIK